MPDDEWNGELPKPSDSSEPDDPGASDPAGARHAAEPDPQTGPSETDEQSEISDSSAPDDARRADAEASTDAGGRSGTDASSSAADESPATDPSDADTSAGQPAATSSRTARSPMARTIGYTVLGAVFPGSGLIAARRRLVGGIVLGVFVALLLGAGVWAIADTQSLISAAVNPSLLRGVGIGFLVLGLAWVVVIIVSHLVIRHTPMSKAQRIGTTALVGVLCFLVAAPMAIAARYSYAQADLVSTVFKHESHSHSATRPDSDQKDEKSSGDDEDEDADPWSQTSRVNVLLLGGDAGKDRVGNRTDTAMVASIDTKTGDTTLIGLPRNTTRMPFPKDSPLRKYYPNGFTNGRTSDPQYFLNALYENVPKNVPDDILGQTDNLGADAMKLSVGAATGLKIDYYVLINLDGFKQLIDALGGITVNINTYVAIGGDTDRGIPPDSYLKPGPHQHLDGKKALWFARGRYGADDFQRMGRQRCVINAIIDQAHPANVLARYESIVKAGKEIAKTDIPQEKLSDFVDLSNRVKDGHIRSLVFKNGKKGFHSSNPDFDRMRKQVKESIGEAKKPPKTEKSKKKSHAKKTHQQETTKPTSSPSPSITPSSGSTPSSSPSSQSRSTTDACAWDPEKAAKAQPPR